MQRNDQDGPWNLFSVSLFNQRLVAFSQQQSA